MTHLRRVALSAPLAALVLLAGANGALAQKKKDEIKLETTELRGVADYIKILGQSERMIAGGQHHEALLKLIDVVETGDDAEDYFRDAQYLLGVVLYHLGLYQSSYTFFEKVLDAPKRHRRYGEILPWLVAVHQKIPGETATLERMSEYPEASYPADVRDEIYFYVGQFHFYQGTLRKALVSLQKVSNKQEEFYLRSLYLQSVVHVRNNAGEAAKAAVKKVLEYADRSGLKTDAGKKIHQMALLTAARIAFTVAPFQKKADRRAASYGVAIDYYDQISQGSPNWLESLLEVSWAYFHLGNYGRSLGNLHTLNSPYFEEEYFPEALVLESVLLYRACYFEEALTSINKFIASYLPLFKELDAQLKVPRDPNQFYSWLSRVSRSGSDISLRLKRIFNAALTDRKLNRAFRFILHLNSEIDALKRLSQNAPMTAFAATLLGEIQSFRALVVGEAGGIAKERLTQVHKDLRFHLSNALKVKVETLNKQKRFIELGLKSAPVSDTGKDYVVDNEHMYWPFKGEYWKDELGSYTVGIKSRCPARRAAPPAKPAPTKTK